MQIYTKDNWIWLINKYKIEPYERNYYRSNKKYSKRHYK